MSNEAKVGGMVLATLLALTVTFFYIANVQLGKQRVTYKTYFKNASGLEPGTMVRYGGMRAGVVTQVRPSKEDPTTIEVLLEVNSDVPVNADSVALAAAISPVGNKHLEITAGTKTARRLRPGETISSREEISLNDLMNRISKLADEASLTVADARKAINSITTDAGQVLVNLKALTGEENQRNVAKIIEGANNLLEREAPKISRIVENVDRLTADAERLISDARQVTAGAGKAVANINQTVEEIREPLKTDLAELEKTIREARATLEQVRRLVGVNEARVNEMMENLERVSRDLTEFTAQIKQRPWSLIRVKPEPDTAPGAER